MIFFFAAFVTAMYFGNSQDSALQGVVVDVTGGAIPRSTIMVFPTGSKVPAAKAETDRAGEFRTDALRKGSYRVTVRSLGFRLRVWNDVIVRDGEITNLGKLQLELSGCDAPGVICDTVTSEPVFPALIRHGELSVKINCGADLRKGTSACPGTAKADFALTKDGGSVFVVPTNGAKIYAPGFPSDYCRDTARSDPKVQLDSVGLDFCVRRDGHQSHVYLETEVAEDSSEVVIWFTTTKAK